MVGIRILVANEPRSYRDVLAQALQALRPAAEVIAAEPENLDADVARYRPHLVLCSRAAGGAAGGVLAWVVLNPDGADCAVAEVAGHHSTLRGVDLAALLAVIDQTQRLVPPAAQDCRCPPSPQARGRSSGAMLG